MWWLIGLFVSFLITFFSFPPFGLGWLMFVGIVPVFIAMEKAPTWKSAFFRTWLFVFFTNIAICFWVGHTMEEFAKVPWYLGYPCVALLSITEQAAWPIMAALRHVIHRRIGLRPLFWTPLTILVLDALWPKVFPNTAGNVFYQITWMREVADVAGVWGLTALLAASNEIVAMLILRTWPKPQLRKHVVATAVLFAVVIGYGAWRHQQIQDYIENPTGTLKVALIQPNINSMAKVRAEKNKNQARAEVLSQLLRLSKEAVAAKPDLIVWPETAYPSTYHSDWVWEPKQLTKQVDDFVLTSGIPLLFGGKDWQDHRRYNTIYLATPQDGKIEIQRYYKNILLLLGEKIPFSSYFPRFAQFLAKQGGALYGEGSGPKILNHSKAKLGPMICYEGLFPRYIRKVGLQEIDMLVNVTNDSWYGPTTEPALHLYLTTFRSIETRLPMIRSTNTGHTAIVDIDGSLRVKTRLNEEAVLIEDVPIYPRITTLFMRYGELFLWLAAIWMLFPFLWARCPLRDCD